jgi:hypothetical protein
MIFSVMEPGKLGDIKLSRTYVSRTDSNRNATQMSLFDSAAGVSRKDTMARTKGSAISLGSIVLYMQTRPETSEIAM